MKLRKHLNNQEKLQIIELYNQNKNITFILNKLNLKSATTIFLVLKKYGISKHTKYLSLPTEIKEQIINEYKEGVPSINIAEKFNLKPHNISTILRDNHIPRFPKRKLSQQEKQNILLLLKKEIPKKEICKLLNLSKSTINMIDRLNGITKSKIIIPHKICSAVFCGIKSRAKKRNFIFNLDKDYLINLYLQQNKICALSGQNISLRSTNRICDGTASLDRIDNSKGYIKGNVQWVHKQINFMKQSLSDQELKIWCQKIINYNTQNINEDYCI